MDNGIVLAPTPIVRITSEQLEYLIGRVRSADFTLQQRRKWTIRQTSFTGVLNQLVNVLGIDETRKVILVGAAQTGVLFQPGPGTTTVQGIQIPPQTTGPLTLEMELHGYSVTRDWWALFTAATVIQITEFIGPPSIESV